LKTPLFNNTLLHYWEAAFHELESFHSFLQAQHRAYGKHG